MAQVDEAIAQAIRSRFYVSDDLRYRHEPDVIVLIGTVECEGNIRVEVTERLRVVRESVWFQQKDNPALELLSYENNAVLRNRGNIFRYNSPHADHNQFHHVHRYDVFGDNLAAGSEIRPPNQLHERDVPTLRQMMAEAENWYHTNFHRL